MEKHQFEEKISQYVDSNKLLTREGRIIVTLSGGADSVALLLVLLNLGYDIVALHCNFHLRGTESDRDEAFVRGLCKRLSVALKVKNFDVASYEQQYKVSTEMACRELRYAWFEKERQLMSAEVIAVAHHSDDNIETLFLNMLRGSGISGLAGIKPRNGYIARPLLCVNRADVEKYLLDCNQDYVTDSTNKVSDYKRNKLRNIILPVIKEQFPEAETGLLRTLRDMSGCFDFYQYSVDKLKGKMVKVNRDGTAEIFMRCIDDVEQGRSTALFEILKEYGYNSVQVDDMLSTWDSNESVSGKKYISQDYIAVFNRDTLEIMRQEDTGNDTESIINLNDVIHSPIEINREIIGKNENEGLLVDGKDSIALDMSVLDPKHKIILRHWRQGDRFKPFGMKGTKLLSDIFSDAKLSEK